MGRVRRDTGKGVARRGTWNGETLSLAEGKGDRTPHVGKVGKGGTILAWARVRDPRKNGSRWTGVETRGPWGGSSGQCVREWCRKSFCRKGEENQERRKLQRPKNERGRRNLRTGLCPRPSYRKINPRGRGQQRELSGGKEGSLILSFKKERSSSQHTRIKGGREGKRGGKHSSSKFPHELRKARQKGGKWGVRRRGEGRYIFH